MTRNAPHKQHTAHHTHTIHYSSSHWASVRPAWVFLGRSSPVRGDLATFLSIMYAYTCPYSPAAVTEVGIQRILNRQLGMPLAPRVTWCRRIHFWHFPAANLTVSSSKHDNTITPHFTYTLSEMNKQHYYCNHHLCYYHYSHTTTTVTVTVTATS